MKRKLIKQGAGGFTITLPIQWIREHNLEQGAEVESEETEEGILISSGIKKKEKSIDLDITKYDRRMLLNLLNQSYRLGYDTIKLKYTEQEQATWIEEITPTLLGFEGVEKKNNVCTLQNIAEPDEAKFEVILRKIFLQIIELSEKTTKSIETTKYNEKETETIKEQIDKLTNYARRAIIRKRRDAKTPLLYGIITQLSLISHAYIYLSLYAAKKKYKRGKKIAEHLQKANNMFREYYEAFYNKDFVKLSNVGKEKIMLETINNSLLEQSKGTETVILTYIREIMRNVHMCTPATIGYYL